LLAVSLVVLMLPSGQISAAPKEPTSTKSVLIMKFVEGDNQSTIGGYVLVVDFAQVSRGKGK